MTISNKINYIFSIMLALAVSIGCNYLSSNSSQYAKRAEPKNEEPKNVANNSSVVPTTNKTQTTAEIENIGTKWRTYSDKKYGFEFKYPRRVTLETDVHDKRGH